MYVVPCTLLKNKYDRNVDQRSLQSILKKNQNTPRPSDHPPVMGGEMPKRLGGIKGCKYKPLKVAVNTV